MKKLFAILQLFRKGSELAEADKWKRHQITATMLGVFILACVQVCALFGIVIPVDSEMATTIGAGVIGLVNVVLTMLTSKRAGLPATSEQTPEDVQRDDGGEVPAYSQTSLEEARRLLEEHRGRQYTGT